MEEIRKISLMVGIAGQQKFVEGGEEVLLGTATRLLDKLRRVYPNTPVKLISTLLPGAQRIFAMAAISSGCALHVALPMELERYREEQKESEKELFESLLAKAERVFNVPEYEAQPERVVKKNAVLVDKFGNIETEIPSEFYHKQAMIYMAKHSNILLACWDGRKLPEEERAGDFTLEAMQLAQKQPFGKMAGNGIAQNTGIVFRITIPSIRTPRMPEHPPVYINIFAGVKERKPTRRGMKIKQLWHIEKYNKDTSFFAKVIFKKIEKARAIYVPKQSEEKLCPTERSLLQITAQADILSENFERIYIIWAYMLAIVALALAIFAMFFKDNLVFACTTQVLISIFAINFSGRRRYSKRSARYMLLSKILKIQLYMEFSNIREYFFQIPFWQKSSEIIFAERVASTLRKTNWENPMPKGLELVYRQWIASKFFADYAYEAKKRQGLLVWLQRLAGYGALASIALVFFQGYIPGIAAEITIIAAATVIAFSICMAGRQNADGREKLSAISYRSLKSAKKRIISTQGAASRRLILSIILQLANEQTTQAIEGFAYNSKRIRRRGKNIKQERAKRKKRRYW